MTGFQRELLHGARLATRNPDLQWDDVYGWATSHQHIERYVGDGCVSVHSDYTSVWYIVREENVRADRELGELRGNPARWLTDDYLQYCAQTFSNGRVFILRQEYYYLAVGTILRNTANGYHYFVTMDDEAWIDSGFAANNAPHIDRETVENNPTIFEEIELPRVFRDVDVKLF